MNPSLNPLVTSVKESATLAINLKARALRAQGRDIAHFGFGQAAFPVPELLQNAVREHADSNMYLPTQGMIELREAVSRYYREEFSLDYSTEQICVGPGSKELIFQTLYLVEGALLVPAPSWVSYGPQATLRGKEVVPIATSRENSYKLTPDELDRACYSLGQQQKMLILNNPNNPTGAVYTQNEVDALSEICRAYQVIVISDEIYAGIDFTGKTHASIAKSYPEGTIVSGGLSKLFACGGYRLGVMMFPQSLNSLLRAIKAIISETFSCVSAPIQFAGLAAYNEYDKLKPFVERTNDIYKFASLYLWERFIDMGLNCPKPMGAFYLFPDFDNFKFKLRKHGLFTGLSLSKKILDEADVAILPGSDFYFMATHLGARVASVDFDGARVYKAWPERSDNNSHVVDEFFPNLKKGCDQLEGFLGRL
ncbi:MAG: aminotransferase class I/II-fold pyridoxal phosphate-dependent enzyme [Spirochaetales bacterium]|uniref:Aminotransferase class I/II-fold pyridoxal phosphate-dependent enzyme n=1 Tax=Candidatus Thalassospirochaeta sargassi TaxID=3119039 RepID=A0AAJ1II40_9SPIO|nr:aminotransferase class I/II-fold pyridoxal phosphate-dependent enzyme [Spirochaetales bacterium]